MIEVDEKSVISLFTTDKVEEFQIKDSKRGDEDLRVAVLVTETKGRKLVVKIAGNAFTTPESVAMWQRCAQEYRKLGYYCPRIFTALDNTFPRVMFRGKECVAYAEEFSLYDSVDNCPNPKPYRDSLYLMTAKVAKKRFDYTTQPSGYTLIDIFPGDEIDEVSENAKDFADYCETLPERFHEQTRRMYARWLENRAELEKVYHDLPFSVFQADLNDTNVLVNPAGEFVGVYDFNIAGRDQFVNYMFREIIGGTFDEELAEILRFCNLVKKEYEFTAGEIAAAPLIYRCIKPLWFYRVDDLKECGSDETRIATQLDAMEYAQTREIDFRSNMT